MKILRVFWVFVKPPESSLEQKFSLVLSKSDVQNWLLKNAMRPPGLHTLWFQIPLPDLFNAETAFRSRLAKERNQLISRGDLFQPPRNGFDLNLCTTARDGGTSLYLQLVISHWIVPYYLSRHINGTFAEGRFSASTSGTLRPVSRWAHFDARLESSPISHLAVVVLPWVYSTVYFLPFFATLPVFFIPSLAHKQWDQCKVQLVD